MERFFNFAKYGGTKSWKIDPYMKNYSTVLYLDNYINRKRDLFEEGIFLYICLYKHFIL